MLKSFITFTVICNYGAMRTVNQIQFETVFCVKLCFELKSHLNLICAATVDL